MSLPRFTSGSVGNLNFSHLNDAFGYIDLARGEQTDRPNRPNETLPLIVAKITQTSETGDHAWTEIAYQNGEYITLTNGRTSGTTQTGSGNDVQFEFPARMNDGQKLAAGSEVLLVPKRDINGSIFYLIIPISLGARAIMITGVQQVLHQGRMWVYNCRRVTFVIDAPDTGARWEYIGDPETAVNGCENPIDQLPVIGVGTVIPYNAQASRKPIKPGTVAIGTKIGPSWWFSIPNGYSYTCPP